MRIPKIIRFLLIVGLILGGVYIFQVYQKSNNVPEEELIECERFLEKETFSICLPEGWAEVQPPEDALAMVSNTQKEVIDFEGEPIDFWGYFSIAQKDRGEKNLAEYVDFVKDSLTGAIPGINFTHQESATINNQTSYFIETEAGPADTDFKFLIVLIEGKNDTAWTITFTSIKRIWLDYKDLFYNTAKTFREK